jgi:hypothetical protein
LQHFVAFQFGFLPEALEVDLQIVVNLGAQGTAVGHSLLEG